MHRRIVVLAGVPVVALLLPVVGWLAFGRSETGTVAGNVEVAGTDVGGMSREEVGAVLDRVDAELVSDDITISTPSGPLSIDPAAIKLTVDREAVTAAALDAGKGGLGILQPARWLWHTVSPVRVPIAVDFDRVALARLIAEGDPTGRVEPVEPTIVLEDGSLTATTGTPGRGIRPEDVADAIVATAASDRGPLSIQASAASLAPTFDQDDVEELLDGARALTGQPAEVRVGDAAASIPAATLQGWLTTRSDDTEHLVLAFTAERVIDDLAKIVGDVGAPAGDATIAIEGGKPAIVPGSPGTKCCAPETAVLLFDALGKRAPQPIELPLTIRPPDRTTDELTALGIVEKIGEFTTRHKAGESRVVNIHRIADLVRGQVIEPGQSFSVNSFVGRRTVDGGFVTGGVIQNGVFSESVGGGISQFATTLFNAAFFGGLDFDEYQSHSIYISRYPYGREATLSYPKPDLVIRNSTPHGVLIWTEYTSTSITVSLWSTRYATGQQTGQTTSPNGRCTRVQTERTRTYVDGHTAVDSVAANYRPAEGVTC